MDILNDLTYETVNTFKKNFEGFMKPINFSGYINRVKKWNEVAAKARGFTTPIEKQWDFVEEEWRETLKALAENNKKEFIDGLIDTFVTLSYAAYLTQQDEYIVLCEEFPELRDISYISDCVRERKNPVAALNVLVNIISDTDMDLRYNFEQVLSSNDSKYPKVKWLLKKWKTDDIGYAMVYESLEIENHNDDRYSQVYGKVVDDRVVFFDSNSKIMKPSSFFEPKIRF